MGDIAKLCAILTVVCLLNGLALGYVRDTTRAAIEKSAAATLAASLKLVLPGAEGFSGKKAAPLPDGRSIDYYEGYARGGGLAGFALCAERPGYQSPLKALVGIDRGGTVQGVKVIAQAETPGLGARIEEIEAKGTLWGRLAALFGRGGVKENGPAEPWFQAQYKGLSPGEITLLRAGQGGAGIHAVTGATITSRAITDSVRETIEGFLAAMKEKGG